MNDFNSHDWSECRFPTAYIESLFNFTIAHPFKKGLEIGYDSGSSAIAFLRACPEARLTSVDINPIADGNVYMETTDVSSRHEFISANSVTLLPEMQKDGLLFDFIYVDGDHNYEGALEDIGNSANLLEENGIMIIDDCEPGHAHFGVFPALMYFLQYTKFKFAVDVLPGNPNGARVLTRI